MSDELDTGIDDYSDEDLKQLGYEDGDAGPTEQTVTVSEMTRIVENLQIELSVRRDALAFAIGSSTNAVATEVVQRAKVFEDFLLGKEVKPESD